MLGPRRENETVRNGWPAQGYRNALLGLVASALPLAYLQGFTVDDALIVARYAAHLATGEGYRFNAQGEISDGLTPLGFAYLLAPFAKDGVLSAFQAARILGAAAWLLASMALGIAIGRASSNPLRHGALLLVATSAPLAAWSVAGLETGLATALATIAVVLPRGPRSSLGGAFAAGLVAWLRPEALPFALVLGVGRGFELSRGAPIPGPRYEAPIPGPRYEAPIPGPRYEAPIPGPSPASGEGRRASVHGIGALTLSALPFLLVVLIRLFVFGRPVPLSVLAKPSDLSHGATYALACALLTGGPIAAFAPLAWRKLDAWPKVLLLASLAHFAAVLLAGGDWMPLSRLVVPALPALALASAHVLSVSKPAVALPRLALALAGTVFVLVRVGPTASRVLDDRLALIESARAPLANIERVAALDIGWLGASTSAEIVDLAGVTNLDIAALPGGHTSKPVSLTMLRAREIDALITLDPPRKVESRLLDDPAFANNFEAAWQSPQGLPVRYTMWRRRN